MSGIDFLSLITKMCSHRVGDLQLSYPVIRTCDRGLTLTDCSSTRTETISLNLWATSSSNGFVLRDCVHDLGKPAQTRTWIQKNGVHSTLRQPGMSMYAVVYLQNNGWVNSFAPKSFRLPFSITGEYLVPCSTTISPCTGWMLIYTTVVDHLSYMMNTAIWKYMLISPDVYSYVPEDIYNVRYIKVLALFRSNNKLGH